jgi:hypothetical protein
MVLTLRSAHALGYEPCGLVHTTISGDVLPPPSLYPKHEGSQVPRNRWHIYKYTRRHMQKEDNLYTAYFSIA